jgi:hypothetical protein
MVAWLQNFREKYWRRISVTIIVVCWALFIVGSQIDAVSSAFINSGALQLLILTVLLEMSFSASRQPHSAVKVASRDSDVGATLVSDIRDKHIAQADLLEFSGVAVEDLIRALATKGCRVRLLVKHPDSVGAFQKRRIISNLEALYGRDYIDRVEIRCYTFPASLRGRKLGSELINLGWYTPFIENGSLARYEVMGHDNALVTAPLSSREGEGLAAMFQLTFDALWSANGTEDGRTVVDRYEAREVGEANRPPSS